MFRTLDISTSGLIAQRQRMNTVAGNVAQINTTQNEQGEPEPFLRRIVTFQADTETGTVNGGQGVTYQVDVDNNSPPRMVLDPGHPHANADGYVAYPNINLVTEFVNALEASRAYEANVAVIDMSKQMAQQALQILA